MCPCSSEIAERRGSTMSLLVQTTMCSSGKINGL